MHIGIREKLDPLNTRTQTLWPDQDPAYNQPTALLKTGISAVIIDKFIPYSKLFRETENFLIDGASFKEIKFSDPLVLKPQT